MNNSETKYILLQVKIWDWFAKLLPLIIFFSLIISYYLGYKNYSLLYTTAIIFFITFIITWWFWVIYTIASLAIIMSNSGKNLKEIIDELKEIKKVINDRDNNSNRKR